VVIPIPIGTVPNDLNPGAYRRRISKTPRIYGLEVAVVRDCAGFMSAFSSASTAPRSASAFAEQRVRPIRDALFMKR
jgi:hypothetical protein